jgi:hypothetical protein
MAETLGKLSFKNASIDDLDFVTQLEAKCVV